MEVAVRVLDQRLRGWGFPHYGSALSAGLDLFACVPGPVTLEPLAPAILIPAGFALRIGDPDWAALIYPRSGQGHKRGLVLGNTVGVIDADYEGEIMVSAWNRGVESIAVQPGERIAQLVLTRIVRPRLILVESFEGEASARGGGGFGSTG